MEGSKYPHVVMSCWWCGAYSFALPNTSALHLDMGVTTPNHMGNLYLLLQVKKECGVIAPPPPSRLTSLIFLLSHGTHQLAPPCTPSSSSLQILAMSITIKLPCALSPFDTPWCQFHRHPSTPESIIISRCISFMHLLYSCSCLSCLHDTYT